MSIIDLYTRTTNSWEEYHKNVQSQNSMIFVSQNKFLSGQTSINLTVGTQWYDECNKKNMEIPSKGLRVKSGESVIICTHQEIAVPYNVYGVIYGVGENIFKAGFISSGKINPGFNDGVLKIGYYNGSKHNIIFKTGDILASCAFFEVEKTSYAPTERYNLPGARFEDEDKSEKLFSFITSNWYAILSVIISIIAIIISVLSK